MDAEAVAEAEYFTKDEALQLIGKRYQATAGYAGVPQQTIGKVVDYYNLPGRRDQYGVDMMWEAPGRENLWDGFSRKDLLMTFTAGPHVGQRAMVPLDGGL